MRSTKEVEVEQLAQALAQPSPKQAKSLIEILERENLKARRALVRRQVARGQVVTEKQLFKDLN